MTGEGEAQVAERLLTSEGTPRVTETVAAQLAAERSFIPVQSILDTVASGTRIPDPPGVANYFMYSAEAGYNGSVGRLEVLVDEASNAIAHVLYRSAPMSANFQLERLRELIQSAKSGAIAIGEFCKGFERIYNLELVKSSVAKDELRALSALFDKVVWYSPFPEERARIPQYLGEPEIRQALAHFDVRTSTSRLESGDKSGAQESE